MMQGYADIRSLISSLFTLSNVAIETLKTSKFDTKGNVDLSKVALYCFFDSFWDILGTRRAA